MARTVNIQPVPRRGRREAVRHVAVGAQPMALSELPLRRLREIVSEFAPEHVHLWWAREGRRCLAAALVLQTPGRVGFLFLPPDAGQAEGSEVLTDVVRAVTQSALQSVAFVQSLAPPDAHGQQSILRAAGYSVLADLRYLHLDLRAWQPQPVDPSLGWSCWGQFTPQDLSAVIVRTYEQSMDCPALAGKRPIEDVLASHRSSGRFQPDTWWIVRVAGQPAGCILLNDSQDLANWEVVYVGVAPEFRGRGLCRQMLRRACAFARESARLGLNLAVDAANVPARKAYEREGFREARREWHCRVLWP